MILIESLLAIAMFLIWSDNIKGYYGNSREAPCLVVEHGNSFAGLRVLFDASRRSTQRDICVVAKDYLPVCSTQCADCPRAVPFSLSVSISVFLFISLSIFSMSSFFCFLVLMTVHSLLSFLSFLRVSTSRISLSLALPPCLYLPPPFPLLVLLLLLTLLLLLLLFSSSGLCLKGSRTTRDCTKARGSSEPHKLIQTPCVKIYLCI